MSSEVSGRCVEVFAHVGESIPDTGLFACLDTRFIDLEIELNRSEQQRLRADIAYYQKEVKRLSPLARSHSASQADLDRMTHQLTTSRHQLHSQQVQADILQEKRRRHCIPAPPGWLVSERGLEPGQWVNAGQAVAMVGDFRRPRLPFALSAEELSALQTQHDIALQLDGYAEPVSAALWHVSPAFDPVTRKIAVELRLRDALPAMRGGLRASLRLRLADPANAFIVPQSALRERYESFLLTRPDGSEISVVRLGKGTEPDTLRVTAPELSSGQHFLRHAPSP